MFVLLQVLAKEVLHSRKAISRLYVNKAQMMSIGNALAEQLGELSVQPQQLLWARVRPCSSACAAVGHLRSQEACAACLLGTLPKQRLNDVRLRCFELYAAQPCRACRARFKVARN
jgi:hypothetical protein